MNLLKKNNLKQLVTRNMDIQNEIKSFDHDIQSLVFDNYSKFISSIDTVKKMKESIEKVEKKMTKLEQSVGKINTLSEKIDSTLSIKRSEIQKLDLINKDLSNLKKLCEYPNILKSELKKYKETVNELLRHSDSKQITPIDYNKEILEALNLNSLFLRSSEYYLECWEKLNKFKEEPLIKPLYQESKLYISEIKNILYALALNKN
jgi:methyl-accepting chemotaxis protein